MFVHCLELVTTVMAEFPVHSRKQKSVSSLSFQSKTTEAASSLRFPPSAVDVALFTCFQKSVVMRSSSSTAIVKIKGGDPIFLDIGDEEPVLLFGGFDHLAVISDKGEVIFINRYAVKNSPNSRFAAVSIPNGEKASSVACMTNLVVVLSSNGRVFSSSFDYGSNVLRFVSVSDTLSHCLAVNKEGHVFGLGSNASGQLSINEETSLVSSFTEISSLLGYEIRAAYAGCNHSLFETREGKILSCGSNLSGQLLINGSPSFEKYYSPIETTIVIIF